MIKIIILALAWIFLGVIGYCVTIGRSIVKLIRLDPDLDRFNELFKEAVSRATFGIIPKNYNSDELRRDFEKMTSLPYSIMVLRDFVLWPASLGTVAPKLDEAIETIKDEYDRGIRIRKEKELP